MTTEKTPYEPDDVGATQPLPPVGAPVATGSSEPVEQIEPTEPVEQIQPTEQVEPVVPTDPAAPWLDDPQPTPADSGPGVDPAAQWNVTAQQSAQHSPEAAIPVQDPRDRGLRVGTVVWGFIIVAVGAGILALALGATYDLDLALIALLSVAGLVLVIGSVVSSARRSSRDRAPR